MAIYPGGILFEPTAEYEKAVKRDPSLAHTPADAKTFEPTMEQEKTGNRPNQRIADAIHRAKSDIAILTDWFELELGKTSNTAPTQDRLNMVNRARSELIQALSLFSGVARASIERSLGEMHL